MGREVPIKPNNICDNCGHEGWCYDFYGDYICQECLDEIDFEDEMPSDYDDEGNYTARDM